jgi:membrane protease subunit (stomatin/prohibitin family)
VIAGTATSVSNRVSRRQAARWSQQDEQQQQQQMYAQPAPATAAPAQTDSIAQLKELAALKESGVLTQAEFDAQKAKILAG